MTADERQKLERLDDALRQCTDIFGLRVPVRQIRLFCSLIHNPIPPRTVQELSHGVRAPVSTVWADMHKLGRSDRHGDPGLDMVTEISDRSTARTTFVVNSKGYAAAQKIAACL